MKYLLPIAATLAVATALPAASPAAAPAASQRDIEALVALEKRQRVGTTENDFVDGGCQDVIFLFARGSTEIGNMGTIVGPDVASALQSNLAPQTVAIQGVDYAAGLATNFLPGGADPDGVAEMERLLADAVSQCPDSAILVGGYSQGAAVAHRAIEDQPAAVVDRINGVVTFGDTQNEQDGGQIPNFPQEKTQIFCARGDLVCVGTLTITAAHLSYGDDAAEAAAFLAGTV